MRVAVIGGGVTGLAVAYRLAEVGAEVSVFEADRQLGGLATYHDYGPFYWDRFYHVILPSDRHLLAFLGDIGLGDEVVWKPSRTGYYEDERFYSISNSLEFARFPPLTLTQKLRLALAILYCSRVRDWRALEQITVGDWLLRLCGRRTFEKFWRPMLLAKLGDAYQRVSAVFIWSYIQRLFSARDRSAAAGEQLGHVRGGYRTVLARLVALIGAAGGAIRPATAVQRISAGERRGGLLVETATSRERFDKVVFTSPMNVLRRVVAEELVAVSSPAEAIEYLGVICMVLVTRKPLVPFYVVNIADRRIPFTGIIGMSNIVPLEETAGRHVTFLPKYVLADDPLLRAPDEELRPMFLEGLRRMLPGAADKGIESVHINRAFRVQPLQVLGYSRLVPEVETRHPGLYVLNTAQFVGGTVNNNHVVESVDRFVARYGRSFSGPSAVPREPPVGVGPPAADRQRRLAQGV